MLATPTSVTVQPRSIGLPCSMAQACSAFDAPSEATRAVRETCR
jgi:hypothetical protein